VVAGRRPLAVAGALAIVYVVWGSTYLGIALAIESIPPLLHAGVRFVLAGAILLWLTRRRSSDPAPGRSQWAAALLTGTLLLGIGNGGVSWGQQHVASGIAALMIATIPLWVVVLDRLVYGARLPVAAIVGVVVGFAGIVLLVNPSSPEGLHAGGTIALLLAALGWSAGTLLSRGQRLTVPPLVGAGMQMLCGGGVLVVAGLATGELGRVDLGAITLRSGLALAYLVVFGSLVAFSAYAWLLRNARTSLVATYAYVNPVVAVTLGWLVLDERVTVRTLAAGALILGAVALIVTARDRPEADREAAPESSPPAPGRTPDRRRAAAALRGR
jgi:drug/metabolite transporter (DMT)-like permease